MISRIVFYFLLGISVFLSAEKIPLDFRYEDLKDYLGMLSSVSGMVFTLMGIWIAFLYPNALARLVNPEKIETADFSETLDETRRLEKIVSAVLVSALVLMAALLIMLTKVFLYRSAIYLEHVVAFKSGALGLTAALSLMQIEAVLSVVFANVMFINDLHRKRQDRQNSNSL